MSNMKYEFTGETKEWCGHTLHRIRAIVDIAYAKAGEVGGWIESESNLSEGGDAWVYDNAEVCGNAEGQTIKRLHSREELLELDAVVHLHPLQQEVDSGLFPWNWRGADKEGICRQQDERQVLRGHRQGGGGNRRGDKVGGNQWLKHKRQSRR